jgi:hypothetical protein
VVNWRKGCPFRLLENKVVEESREIPESQFFLEDLELLPGGIGDSD